MGEALKFIDDADRSKGFLFDGRITEDFKLSSGTWVSVGPLRAKIIAHFAPYFRDVGIAGLNPDDFTGLAFPDVEACGALCANAAKPIDAAAILADPSVRNEMARRLAALATQASGSSTRLARLVLLAEPPSLIHSEITDKGSINQRAVLTHRADLVEELYAKPYSPRVLTLEGA